MNIAWVYDEERWQFIDFALLVNSLSKVGTDINTVFVLQNHFSANDFHTICKQAIAHFAYRKLTNSIAVFFRFLWRQRNVSTGDWRNLWQC